MKTTNAGVNWIVKQSNTVQILREVDFPSINIGYTCGDTGTVLKSTDGGESWSDISVNDTINLYGLAFPNALTGYVSGQLTTIFKTTNGGINWFEQNTNVGVNGDLGPMIFLNLDTGFIIGGFNLKTLDGGLNWFENMTGGGNDIKFPSALTGYRTGGSGIISKSTNGGLNYVAQNANVSSVINSLFFLDDNNGFAVGRNGAITKTINGGNLWTAQEKITFNDLKSVYFTDADNGYITGNFGTILKTTNGGLVFISQNSEIIPEDFTLHQNYPNPFNAGTIIKYDLKTSGFVELKIYDVTGKEILNLVSEEQSEGSYSVLFSTNENDKQLNSGFFFTHYI
ncbi:MAG: T9SS type A sorting domain-containing protein [Ignavibacteria bacterium]